MTIQKIYIRLFDGTEVWVPIEVKLVHDDQFEIIENAEFNNLDINELYEFFPGDIVESEQHIFMDWTKGQIAKKLISKGQWPDRKFHEFKFKATYGQLNIDKTTIQNYHDEIERIKKEHLAGQFFYPAIIETIDKLNNLIKNKNK
jgi:hypothetical protein